MSASHQREAAIFDAAMELPPEQRPSYLKEACGDDWALRQRVESLLKACESQCVFLDPPAGAATAPLTAALPAFEKPGDTFGLYKLLERIGEGGCGVVYVAEQTEPIRRRVALKIIKLGMDTRSVVARFEAERQALAMMDHPNIARVFNAGATETGRPYFVMELVRGLKITEYSDQAKLSTRARLDLFIQVCQAIQHAHQKGIIHRDIKPSNILVTVNDGLSVPKVIDFGIAKATAGQQLTDKTIYTAFEQFIGTPAYMSPEQAVLTSMDIDTRSDIYALGVLLYELLTGRTPFDAKELLAIGLDEMRRTIREQEPQRPSTRLSTLPGQELSTTAQRRGLDAPKLVSELRGDLDWIVMKALEKDRARRYESANGLVADIQRHLNNEPVVACPPSRIYRLQKMVRRNKVVFSAATAVAAALVAGLIVSAWQAQRAKHERDSAGAVVKFFREKILAAGRPEGWDGGLGRDVSLRKAIDAAEPQIAGMFQNHPLVEAAVRETLGESYHYLGETALAIQQKERVLALRRQHLGIEHPETLKSMNALGIGYVQAGKLRQGMAFLEDALKLRKGNLGPTHPDTLQSMNDLVLAHFRSRNADAAMAIGEEALKLSKANLPPDHPTAFEILNNVSIVYIVFGYLDKAVALLEETLKSHKAKLGPEHPETLTVTHNLALAFAEGGDWDKAVPIYEQVFKLENAKLGPEHGLTRKTAQELAGAYEKIGRSDEAVRLLQGTLGPNHRDTLRTAQTLATQRKIANAKPDELEAMYRQDLSNKRGDVLSAMFQLGRLLAESRKTNPGHSDARINEGEQLLRDYLADARARHANEPYELSTRLADLAALRYRQRNFGEAEPLYREIIQLRRARGMAADNPLVLDAVASLARLLSDWAWAERTNFAAARVTALASSSPQPSTLNSQPAYERAREAERLLREVLAVRLRDATNSWRIGDVKSRLGGALVSVAVTDPTLNAESRQPKLSEAEPLLLEGHERLQAQATDKRYSRDALHRIVRLYEAWNKPDKRVEWQQKFDLFDAAPKMSSASESDAAAAETK